MAYNTKSEKNNMEIRFSGKRLRASGVKSIKRDMHEPVVNQLYIRVAKSCSIEMARQEL